MAILKSEQVGEEEETARGAVAQRMAIVVVDVATS